MPHKKSFSYKYVITDNMEVLSTLLTIGEGNPLICNNSEAGSTDNAYSKSLEQRGLWKQ